MKGCTQREKHAPRGLSVGNFLKAFTLVYFAISFGLSLWVGTSFEASAVLNVLVPVAGLCGLALLAANLLFGLFSLVVPLVHAQGKGFGVASRMAHTTGHFFFVYSLLLIGILGVFSAILSVHGLWSLPWRRRG